MNKTTFILGILLLIVGVGVAYDLGLGQTLYTFTAPIFPYPHDPIANCTIKFSAYSVYNQTNGTINFQVNSPYEHDTVLGYVGSNSWMCFRNYKVTSTYYEYRFYPLKPLIHVVFNN